MTKILMVCLGNICRSPLAEGILRKKLEENNLKAHVDSAGTSSFHLGESPDKRSAKNASSHGIEIGMLKARQFSVRDFDQFDLIFAMDASNYDDIMIMARDDRDRKKVNLILNCTYPGSDMSVPDPYFGGNSGFENVFKLLNEACDNLIKSLK